MLDERLKEDIGHRHGRNTSQTEFCDQTVLEDTKEPIHPSLGFGERAKMG